MDGSKLVHVVTLVAAAAGIHEGEQTRDKQRALVVGHGERSSKNGAGLAVLFLTVGKEKAV